MPSKTASALSRTEESVGADRRVIERRGARRSAQPELSMKRCSLRSKARYWGRSVQRPITHG